jgi:hypothetical protein
VPNIVAQELDLLLGYLPKINGQPIILGKTGVTLARLLESVDYRRVLDLY